MSNRRAITARVAQWEKKTDSQSNEKLNPNRAATKIQAIFRMWMAKKRYKKMLKMHNYRTQIVGEILSTEKFYVSQLDEIIESFLIPLRNSASTSNSILSQEEIKTIFGGLEIIAGYNKELLEKIQARSLKWHPNQKIGDIFKEGAAFLKVYTNYTQNFNASLAQIQKSNSENEKWIQYCKDAFVRMQSSAVDLPTVLIMPVQRIPRYQLLLKELLSHTWQSHIDYQDITLALDKITETAVYVNEKQKEAENIAKVLSIQNTLYGKKLENLVDPQRKFIREGPLKEINDRGKGKEKWFFMFTDILVRCKPAGSLVRMKRSGSPNGLFEYLNQINLLACDIIDYGESEEVTNKFGFELVISSSQSKWLCARSADEKKSWMEDIKDCIANLKRKSDFQDKQATRVATQKAAQAKAMIAEKYAGYRVRGSLTEKPESFGHLSPSERMTRVKEAEENIKLFAKEEKEQNERAAKGATNFKSALEHKYYDKSGAPIVDEQLAYDGVDGNSLDSLGRRASYALGDKAPVQRRKFASMTKQKYNSKQPSSPSPTVTRTDRTQSMQVEPERPAQPTPSLGNSEGGRRRFASMLRANYKDVADDKRSISTPDLKIDDNKSTPSSKKDKKDKKDKPKLRRFPSLTKNQLKKSDDKSKDSSNSSDVCPPSPGAGSPSGVRRFSSIPRVDGFKMNQDSKIGK